MANGQEAVVTIPVVVPPIEVEVALGVVPVEVRHVAVAIDLRDLLVRERRPVHCPSNTLRAESGSWPCMPPSAPHQLSLIF